MNTTRKLEDDFTAINGIGQIREKWLREVFHINTYQELTELPVSSIVAQLKAEGKIVSLSAIEGWIEQARALIPVSSASRQTRDQVNTDILVDKFNSSGHQNGWTPFASFLVYFQTRGQGSARLAYQTLVHHMEQDHETSWPGIESTALSDWMLEQIRGQVDVQRVKQEAKVEQLSESQPKEIERPSVKIEQVRIYQPVEANKPAHRVNAGQHFKGRLKHDRPFKFVVDFSISSGTPKDITGERVPCLARCYEYNNASKVSALLAESPLVNLEIGKPGYTFEIPEASLPCGDYRMWVMVTTVQTSLLAPDFMELPSLILD